MILILCVFCSTHMFGQQIGYVYSDSILLSIPEYGRNVSKLDSLKKSYNKELEQSRISLQQRYEVLVKGYKPSEKETLLALKARMSQADTISLGLLLDEDKMIQKKALSYENMTKLIYTRDIQSVLDMVKKTISEYAISNKLTAIYVMEQIRSSLVYIDSKRDVTKAIIEKLKKKQ